MIKITCAAGFVTAVCKVETKEEADAIVAAMPKGLFFVISLSDGYQISMKSSVNLVSTKVTGEKNEAGIARVRKIMNSGLAEYSQCFANSISEEEFLALIG